jgi:hypothetical protein
MQPKEKRKFLPKSSFFILFVLVLVFCYTYFFTHISVEIELSTDSADVFQLFYAGRNKPYSETHSCAFKIVPDQSTYRCYLTRLHSIKSMKSLRRLRIDPGRGFGSLSIKKIVISQVGYKPLRIDTSEQLKKISALNHIEKIMYNQNELFIRTGGPDPQLEINLVPEIDFIFFFLLLICTLLAAIMINYLLHQFKSEEPFKYAPYLMAFVLALIFSGASICLQMHADEGVHLSAGIYYQNHWLPPAVCEAGTENTYSVYGASRLNTYEIAYFLSGKLARLLTLLNIGDFLRFRLFNIVLFFILLVLSIKHVEYRILSLPLLISPQIWYVFSYFNSDAFGIFVIIIISYQVISPKSLTNRYLNAGDLAPHFIAHPLVIGLLFSLLLFIKLTFYVFILFLLLVLLLKLGRKEYQNPKKVIGRVCLIMLISASMLGLRYGIDINNNGFDKKAKLLACREKLAQPMYKPSTPLIHKHPYLQLKDRGVTIKDMFAKRDWGIISFGRAFGAYFFEPLAKDWYYKFILTISIFFLIYLTFSILLGMQEKQIILLMILGFCSILLITLSIWNSWTASFQAQGRYLFPILFMGAFLISQSLECLSQEFLNFFILTMFALSTYSYIFIGLLQLPKI